MCIERNGANDGRQRGESRSVLVCVATVPHPTPAHPFSRRRGRQSCLKDAVLAWLALPSPTQLPLMTMHSFGPSLRVLLAIVVVEERKKGPSGTSPSATFCPKRKQARGTGRMVGRWMD